MHRLLITTTLAAGLAACTGAGASRQPDLPDTVQARAISAFIQEAAAAQNAPPVFAVAVATREGPIVIEVLGEAGPAGSGVAADADTPFYIASITKSYVGLMATELDRRGVLDLESTLGDHMPGLVLPNGLDPSAISMRDLLSHRSGLNAGDLNFITSQFREPGPQEFVTLLEATAANAGAGAFRYTNTGYLIYAHVLEMQTGRSWRDWLDEVVLDPLALHDSAAHAPGDLEAAAWGHQRTPDGVRSLAPKPTAIMHPAGGMVTTASDGARWLTANLSNAVFPETVWAAHREVQVPAEARMLGATCYGYALGLMACDYGGYDVRAHFGTYDGWRAVMSYSDDLDAGVYVMAAADDMAQMWSIIVERQIYDILQGKPGLDEQGDQRLALFEREAAGFIAERETEREAVLGPAEPGAVLDPAIAGVYRHPVYGELSIAVDEGRAVLSAGAYSGWLMPLGSARYAVIDGEVGEPDVVLAEPGGIVWVDERFERLPD